MSGVWLLPIAIVLISLINVRVYCNCFAPVASPLTSSVADLRMPIALPPTDCNANAQPRYQLIPAGLYSDGVRRFIRPFPLVDALRPFPHRQNSAVVQQVTVNQNAGIGGHGGLGGFGGFHRPLGRPFLRPHLHGFHRPHLFGGFRTQSNEEHNSNGSTITPPNCPLQYMFSCQPSVSEVPCMANKSY